jgi:hypothetical protein
MAATRSATLLYKDGEVIQIELSEPLFSVTGLRVPIWNGLGHALTFRHFTRVDDGVYMEDEDSLR